MGDASVPSLHPSNPRPYETTPLPSSSHKNLSVKTPLPPYKYSYPSPHYQANKLAQLSLNFNSKVQPAPLPQNNAHRRTARSRTLHLRSPTMQAQQHAQTKPHTT